jgi:hypothetical protein
VTGFFSDSFTIILVVSFSCIGLKLQ